MNAADLSNEQLSEQICTLNERIKTLESAVESHQKTEESLSASRKNLDAILCKNADGIIIVDADGAVLYVNPAAEKLFDKRKEDFLGYPFGFPVSTDKAIDTLMIKNGDKFCDVEMRVVKVQWLEGPAFQLSVRDITDNLRLEEQLRQSQKLEAIGTLAGGVAHDFNNMLTAIIGYGQLTLMKMREDDPLRININHILEASQRATILTQSLLAFSRKQPVNLAIVDLNEILAGFEKFLRRLLRESIEFKTICDKRALNIMADSGQIEQVLMNLVTNARDAISDGGRLTIETRRVTFDACSVESQGYGLPGEYALLMVTDTGMGMDEKTKQKVFEPFFTTKEIGKGTGLGLSMVYGIVKKHEGYINIYSEMGHGTIFNLYFPLTGSAIAVDDKLEAPAESVRGGTETVLVAEDDQMLRKLSSVILSESGYTVIEAVDGEDAVAKYIEHRGSIQLVILDGIMPKRNGWQAYEEIQAVTPAVKVMFMSGYSEDVFSAKNVLKSGLAYLLKPVTPTQLLRKVREVLDT